MTRSCGSICLPTVQSRTAIDTLSRAVLLVLALVLTAPASAAGCSALKDDDERLACYDAAAALQTLEETTVFTERRQGERSVWNNRFSILPHRRAYLLPLSYTPEPGKAALDLPPGDSLQRAEVKFQYSFKVPVASGLLSENDQLFVAFTQLSLWQAYNQDLSSPFRETMYEPELIWTLPLSRELLGGSLNYFSVGINHQSNGRGGDYSRSWNRITVETAWATERWAVGLRAWERIKESKDEDDNPDIEDYLGHGELAVGYKWDDFRFTAALRNNLQRSDNRTSMEFGLSWPFNQKLSAYAQFYNGYGETLLDYDQRVRRIGIGIILADWF